MDCVEFQNYIQAQSSLRKATEIIRDVFIRLWVQNFGNQWQDNEIFGNNFETNPVCLKIYKEANTTQKKMLLEGNSKNWDISLLYKILNFPPFNTSKYIIPVKMLKNLRNEIYHNSQMKLKDLKDFRKRYIEAMLFFFFRLKARANSV